LFVIAHQQLAGLGKAKLTLLCGKPYDNKAWILRTRFNRFNIGKIDTAFAIAATALFNKQAFVHNANHIKYSGGKN
jgi:hypothetical protein